MSLFLGLAWLAVFPASAQAATDSHASNSHDFLYVSGLTVLTEPTIGPGGGDLALEFTMKNVSTSPITSSVQFRLDNAINQPIKTLDKVEVANLAPGETRTVTANFKSVGQWTFYRGHVTMTPPADIDGTALWPSTRDSFTLLLPWFLLAVLVLLAALVLAVRQLLRLRRLERPLPGLVPGYGTVTS
ncbi:hypothetical protein E3T26_06625 [Cryobacterium sp. TMT1-21]|uniref:DUF916 domain-containing protein n=1 Tax=Cryobacterium shii TaxID=1259235 RepID=A0AAQ2HEJ3_9MICO|nr:MULTISPECIES: hypothetical protein [Cryobacterium]TFC42581.1 hypothetical protein E3O49_14670 [Cryobacterium shii]TFC80913.1 hypothetical protein E3T24_16215 [Cryobacterium sp. TmT2-59]TFD15559.1 hypothetical protein E3T26_06625 [Cryobacterium sp. TMT1-21]TFD18581.1 hypothetical protein E3T42_04970 [Cryobacterium sp. TMT4-10]TFD28383.1 hypothetical protein E3T32_00495 [Cryobacterium sp. TMT2-23]